MSYRIQRLNEGLSPVELTVQEHHRLLAAERRRLALDILADETAIVDLEDLAAEIAAREVGPDADGEAVERVALSLHHVHLPHMADVGVLDYDPRTKIVEPADRLQFE